MQKNIKILVLDDYATMRKIIINLLSELGFANAYEVESAEQAFEELSKQSIDLLIVDWNMPMMSGLELVKKIRADKLLRQLPILMITAEAKREQINAAADAGVNGYIVKPFTAQTLLARIEKIFVNS